MKSINIFINEKLHLNKDIEITPITDQLSNIIKDFCQNTLGLDTLDYMSHCEDDRGNSVHDKPEKLARIYLYSKKFKDIDDTAKKLEKLLSAVKKVKKTEVFVTVIYFYFEEYESTD